MFTFACLLIRRSPGDGRVGSLIHLLSSNLHHLTNSRIHSLSARSSLKTCNSSKRSPTIVSKINIKIHILAALASIVAGGGINAQEDETCMICPDGADAGVDDFKP